MRPTKSILLRRTFALAAIALAASLPVAGQVKVQLYEGSSGTLRTECTYDEIKTLPSGAVRVNCTSTTTPTGATFGLSGPGSIAVGASSTFTISRTGTSAYSTTPITYSLAGCTTNGSTSGSVTFVNGGVSSFPLPVTGASAGTCTISIAGWTAPDGGSPTTLAIAITSGGGGGGGGPVGCPAPATGSVAGVDINLGVSYKDQFLKSGQIAYFKVPRSPNPAYTVKVEFTQGSTPASPSANVTTEYLVSKCPGVIDEVKTSVASQCYQSGGATVYNKFPIATAPWTYPMLGLTYASQADYFLTCYADNTVEDKYLNVRWTWLNHNGQTGSYTVQWIEAQSP